MKHILSLFILGTLVLSSCKKENSQYDLCSIPAINNSNCITDSNQLRAQIIGRWDWTRSISGWVPVETTPCTDSINRSYEFLSNGVIKYYENGSFVKDGTYSFTSSTLFSVDSGTAFGLQGQTSICDDYLVVDNQPVDGPKTILVKAE